jgi:hypothetical protein
MEEKNGGKKWRRKRGKTHEKMIIQGWGRRRGKKYIGMHTSYKITFFAILILTCKDITKPLVYKLIEDFMEEEDSLFSDPFVHLGGDEVSYDCLKDV